MKGNESIKTVALVALVVILISGGLVYWQWGNRGEAASRVAMLESQLPDTDQVNADLVKSQQDLEESRIRLEHLERALPVEAYIPTLLKELEMLGTSKNVQIMGIRPILQQNEDTSLEPDNGYQKLDIDITGRGTYRAMLEMISALKSFPKIMAVNTIALQPRQDAKTTDSSELDTTIRLRAYVFKEPMAPFEGSTEDLRQKNLEGGESGTEGGESGTSNGTNSTQKSKDLDARAPRKEVAL
jgi:Tfp pilus assembly protein PilO